METKPNNTTDLKKPPATLLKSMQIVIEKKTFTFELKENDRGRFLQILETDGGRAKILIPANGLWRFVAGLAVVTEPEEVPQEP